MRVFPGKSEGSVKDELSWAVLTAPPDFLASLLLTFWFEFLPAPSAYRLSCIQRISVLR